MFISRFTHRAPGKKRPSGFTLVELLVVIGIIALLIAILLPALNKARKAARTASCLSNVRQMCMGMIQYFNDSKGFSPYYDFGGTPPAPFQIEWFTQLPKANQLNAARLCPEAREGPNPAFPTGNQAGAAFFHWGPSGRAMQYFDPADGVKKQMKGSYGYNGYLLKSHASGDDAVLAGGGQAGNLNNLWTYGFIPTSEVPLICDATWPTLWPKETDNVTGVPSIYSPAGSGTMAIGNNWTRLLIARHNMAINVGFMDGHGSTIALPDLWRLRWHKRWNMNSIPGGDPAGLQTIKAYILNKYKVGV